MFEEDDDLKGVMEQEKRRGRSRRPLDIRAKRLREDLRKAIRAGDEMECLRIQRDDAGFEPGTPKFERAWRLVQTALRLRSRGDE